MNARWACLWFGLSGCVLWSQAAAAETEFLPDQKGYQNVVAPFFAKYCRKCHVGEKPQGEFSIEASRLKNDFADAGNRAAWREIVNVLNSHEMPPEKEPQPTADATASVVDWITAQTVRAELAKRELAVVLRRLNRDEYRNTIRDLIGVDFDPSGFPQDPPAGGFDNNGGALTLSPLHLELYLSAAQQILNRALVEGDRPTGVKWRFDPTVVAMDSRRVRLDEKNNALLNGGNNLTEGDWVLVHHGSWDKGVNARDFRVPVPGIYAVRIRAASRIPDRAAVVESAEKILKQRLEKQLADAPNGKKWHEEAYQRDLEHFKNDRMYDYGPARIKFVQQLGPQPRVIAEFDADGTPDKPKTHEFLLRFTTESAGVGFDYAYAIPRVLENFWMQTSDKFARPELLIDWFEIEGPIYDAWPPASHTRILFDSPLAQTDEKKYAREVLARFLRRAYRRPVTDEELDEKLELYQSAREEKPFHQAIQAPLMAALTSPHFLFLVEPQRNPAPAQLDDNPKPAKPANSKTKPSKIAPKVSGAKPKSTPASTEPTTLSDFELAGRMSYFLWSSMPDETLFQLAKDGKLQDAKFRVTEVDRMLADPKSASFVRNFAGQWLGLRDIGANPPAEDLYPQYDRHLELSIAGESESYFQEFLSQDLDLRQMIRSDFVTINERLARFYGIAGVRGDAFRKVAVPEGVQRGGIVTQASILTITSNGTRTSPVKRGTWIMKALLGIDPGLPVANAGEIAPKVPGIEKATVRKRLEIHRELPQCARCHNKIDPLGFALENYNASGEWREREGFGYKGRIEPNDPLIDASSAMLDGTRIQGVRGLQQAMLDKEDLFIACLASKMMTYACGREMGLADQPAMQAAVAQIKQEKYTLRSLIRYIVNSEPFLAK